MLFFNLEEKRVKNFFRLRRVGKTSNASKSIIKLKCKFPIQIKYSKLLLRKNWLGGRCNTGSITVYSKGYRSKKRLPFFNYNFRSKSLYFVAGLNYTSFNLKIASLVFNSVGEVSYLPTKINDVFFRLVRNKPLFTKISPFMANDMLTLKPYIYIEELPYMLIQQKKIHILVF